MVKIVQPSLNLHEEYIVYIGKQSSAHVLGGVSGVASLITTDEQLHYNRGCCFPMQAMLMLMVFPFLSLIYIPILELTYSTDELYEHDRFYGNCYFITVHNCKKNNSINLFASLFMHTSYRTYLQENIVQIQDKDITHARHNTNKYR